MTVRSIASKPKDFHARSGVVVPCKSLTEWHFCNYLDSKPQPWAYEPVTLHDPAGGYRPDIRVLTDPVVWFEVKYVGFLDGDHAELREAMRKLEVLRRHRPHDRIALMPWGFHWTGPQGPWLLNRPRTGWLRVEGNVSVPWQVAA